MITLYCTQSSVPSDIKPGLYIQACANGLHECLDDYRKTIIETETRFLQNPHNPLSTVYVVIYPFNRLMEYLLNMISGIRTQRLHGCAILQYLHKFQFHCVPAETKAVQM